MNATEIARVQKYLRETFDNNQLKLIKRGDTDDSVEVLLGEEFIGVVYRDEDEGEVSYPFHMSILQMDLPEL
ncbi:MAG: DUF3126 family protein [Proteobacteria bacterium]|nr:DUF3126 family protein [Pseudomonadota bacterium]